MESGDAMDSHPDENAALSGSKRGRTRGPTALFSVTIEAAPAPRRALRSHIAADAAWRPRAGGAAQRNSSPDGRRRTLDEGGLALGQPARFVEERAVVDRRALAARGSLEPGADDVYPFDQRLELRQLALGDFL